MTIYSQKFIDMLSECHLAARDNNAEAEQEELIAHIDAQMERDRKDAERFRWLRDKRIESQSAHVLSVFSTHIDDGLDAAIDADLAKNKKEIDAG